MKRLGLLAMGALFMVAAALGCQPKKEATTESATTGGINLTDPSLNTKNWEEVPASQLPTMRDYKPEISNCADVDKSLPIALGQNGMPHSLDGIWWMDGNPLADTAISMANTSYDSAKKVGTLGVFDAMIFAFHGDEGGLNLWRFALALHAVYEVHMAPDEKSAFFNAVVTIGSRHVKIPDWVARFTMELAQDGLWIRHTWIFGKQVGDYRFTRIIKADGSQDHNMDLPDPYKDPWTRYVKTVQPLCYVIKNAS